MKKLTPVIALLLVALWPLAGGSYPTHGNTGGALQIDEYGISNNNVGGDSTLPFLYNLTTIKNPPGNMTKIYVSSQPGGSLPEGLDANQGTMDAPIKTLDKVEEILNERGCGTEIILDGDTWTGATDFGGGIRVAATTCTDTDSVAIYIHSIDPDVRATLDCTGGSATEALQIIGTDGGWMVVEGLHTQNCAIDTFNASGDGKLMVINSGASGGTGVNQMFTGHATSDMILLNVYGSSVNDVTVFTNVTDATMTLISDKSFIIGDTDADFEAAFSSLGGTGVVIGPDVSSVTGATGALRGISVDPEAGKTVDYTFARVNIHDCAGATTGVGLRSYLSTAAGTSSVAIYQSTIANCYYGISNAVVDADSFSTVIARGLLMDEVDRPYYAAAATDSARSLIDIQQTIQDEDEGINNYRCDGSYYATLAAGLAANCANYNVTGAFLPGGATYDSGGTGADGVQWQDTALAITLPSYACHPDSECWGAYEDEYTIALPVPIPAFVLGRQINSFTLGGTDGNIGAR